MVPPSRRPARARTRLLAGTTATLALLAAGTASAESLRLSPQQLAQAAPPARGAPPESSPPADADTVGRTPDPGGAEAEAAEEAQPGEGAPDDAVAAPNEDGENVVIVTANKRTQDLQDVAAAVSVIGGTALEDRNFLSINDLQLVAPSLSTNGGRIRIRGIGTDAFDVAAEPSASFAIDGVVLGRTGQAFVDLVDVERVEVLRGPQGTLFGRNTSAGVVNIVTRDPSRELTAFVKLNTFEFENYDVGATVSGEILPGVRARVTGYAISDRGHIFNQFTRQDRNGRENSGGRLKLVWDATENLTVSLSADVRFAELGGTDATWRRVTDPGILRAIAPIVPGPENRTAAAGDPTYTDTQEYGGILQADLDVNGYVFSSITSYRNFDNNGFDDVDDRPQNGAVGGSNFASGLIRLRQDNNDDIEQWNQEIRVTSPEGQPLEFVAGLAWYGLRFDNRLSREIDSCIELAPALTGAVPRGAPCPFIPAPFPGLIPPGFPGLTFSARANGTVERFVETDSYAAFGQGTIDLGNNFAAVLGGRAQYNRTDFGVGQPFPAGSNVAAFANVGFGSGVGITTGGSTDRSLTGRVGLQWEYGDDLDGLLFATYTSGYKAGTATFILDRVREVAPETSDNFEIGIRDRIWDDRLTVSLIAFYTTFTDLQIEAFNAESGGFVLQSAGESRTKGLEFDLNGELLEGLTVGVNANYVEARITEFDGGQCFLPTNLDPACRQIGVTPAGVPVFGKRLNGARLPSTPDLRFSVNARYENDFSGLFQGGDDYRWFIAGNYFYQTDVNFDFAQSPFTVQDAYDLVDLSAGISAFEDRVSLSLLVRNVFDESYADVIYHDFIATGAGGSQAPNILQVLPRNAERRFGLLLTARY